MEGVDLLRILGTIAVVCIHLPPDGVTSPDYWAWVNQAARFGVPFFFIVSGYFFAGSWLRGGDAFRLLWKSGRRIGTVFLFWALFYAVVPPFVGNATSYREQVEVHLVNMVRYPLHFLTTGGVYHLWFLSSLGQALFILALCLRWRLPKLALLTGIVLYAIGLLSGSYAVAPIGLDLHFYSRNGPFFSTLFVALGAWLALHPPARLLAWGMGFSIVGMTGQFAEVAFLEKAYGVALTSNNFVVSTVPFGLGVAMLGFSSAGSGVLRRLQPIGCLSLGIYVLHPYLIEVISFFPQTLWLVQQPPLMAIGVFAITAAAVWGLSKMKWLKPLIM
jgi:surface polysaccharide O-acyltransferase-like enzyme